MSPWYTDGTPTFRFLFWLVLVRCADFRYATNGRPRKESEAAMFTGPNTIAIKLGDYLQGTAEGPLGIGALLLILCGIAALALLARRA
jgi:hypothetical protein